MARDYAERYRDLTTANLADGCIRVGVPVRCGPPWVRSSTPGARIAGRACPAQHYGSVDIFLEAIDRAALGDVLVVDNAGRLDEACVGDLVVLEAAGAGLNGLVIWGLHRDTRDIAEIGLPVFSIGSFPSGPQRLDARTPDALERASIGDHVVDRTDFVFGDDDGVLIVPTSALDEVFEAAEAIRDTERGQARRMRAGESLRSQVRFREYLAKRMASPNHTFREHLRTGGGAIEV